MKSLRQRVRILVVVVLVAMSLGTPVARAQRYCTVPCGHRMHQYDLAACGHPCYGPYGVYACHPAGDAYPCVHPMHPWDYVPC